MNVAQSFSGLPPKRVPFSRILKGVFFFLVVLIVATQISPLLLLSRLIDQEETRLEARFQEAVAEVRAQLAESAASDYIAINLDAAAKRHNLRRLRLSAFLGDSTGGLWHHRTTGADAAQRLGWDSTTATLDAGTLQPHEFSGLRHVVTNEVWSGTPVQVDMLVATPMLSGLKRQMQSELWLRGLVVAAFLGFTLLFYQSVLLPFHDMRKRAAALIESGILPPASKGYDQDPEYVMATFDNLVHRLSRQAGLLEQRALHSERHARNLERFNEYILSSMTTGVIILDREGEILRFNRAAELILRMPAAAMIGRHFTKSGLSSNLLEMFEAGLTRGEVYSRHELKVEREGANPIYLGINTSCIKSDTDESMGLSILLTDLTTIKRLQDEVAENQRLADLGELAAGLAHQLRNSMAAILGYGRLLRKSAPSEGQLGDWADGLLEETTETSDMISRFLDFARPLHAEEQIVDLAEVIDAAVHAVRKLANTAGVIIDPLTPPTSPWQMKGDELLLKQVFVNLMQNAIEASPRDSHLMIAVQRVTAGPNAGRFLILVTDQGCGIVPENQMRIFHPFFTTKESGTGLGLALARKIVVTHGGSLTLQQSSATGSTFCVSLPSCEVASATPISSSTSATPHT